jgi:hypothetical protein
MKLSAAAKLSDMYPDRHLNVFVPYESHGLDYNVTRALICTLKWSRPELVRAFLKEVTNTDISDSATVLYDLQACDYDDYDPEKSEQRKILGISRTGELATRLPPADHLYQPNVLALLRGARGNEEKLAGLQQLVGNSELNIDDLEVLQHTLEEYEQGSMPDGWIFTDDNQACILIEAKLTRYLDLHQLDRHTETWFGEPMRGDNQILTSWETIAAFALAHSKDECPRTAFLCRQLFEYLELLGHAPFESFKPFDLDGDALLDSLPKLHRLATAVIDAAQNAGFPLGISVTEKGTGLRMSFSDSSWVGVPGIVLNDGEFSFVYVVGEPLDGQPLAGAAGADKVLANTENGLLNPLAGWQAQMTDTKIRVDRLVRDGSRMTIDRTLYDADFNSEEFSEVLDLLTNQHPAPEVQQQQGRSGALIWSRTFSGQAALIDRQELINEALGTFKDFAAIARQLSAAPAAVSHEEAGA